MHNLDFFKNILNMELHLSKIELVLDLLTYFFKNIHQI